MATLTTPVDFDPDAFFKGLGSEPLSLLATLRDQGGACVLPDLRHSGGKRFIVLSDPAAAAAVLAQGVRRQRGLLQRIVGDGLFVTGSGKRWHTRRELMHPAFTARTVEAGSAAAAAAAEAFVTRELLPRTETPFNLARLLRRAGIEVILRAAEPAMSPGELADQAAALEQVTDLFTKMVDTPAEVVEHEHEDLRARIGELHAFIDEMGGTLGCPARRPGQIAQVAAALDPEYYSEPAAVLREEILSVYTAGVEPLGATLTWLFYHLNRYPETLGRCLDELRAADAEGLAVHERPYLRAVIEETLRIAPPNWALNRTVERPINAAGIRLGPGDSVLIAVHAIHHDPRLWPEPEAFRPERFLGTRPPARQFLPFGSGPHQCLGRRLSYVEIGEIATAVLRRGTLALQPEPVRTGVRFHIALVPDPDPHVLFVPHRTAASDSARETT